MLDEIERQLQLGEPRPAGVRSRRTDEQPKTARRSSPTPLLALAVVGGFASVVFGVFLGGIFGVAVSLVGFVAVVIAGVAMVRLSQAAILAQVHEIAERYQGSPR